MDWLFVRLRVWVYASVCTRMHVCLCVCVLRLHTLVLTCMHSQTHAQRLMDRETASTVSPTCLYTVAKLPVSIVRATVLCVCVCVCVQDTERKGCAPVSTLLGTLDLDNNHRDMHINTFAATLFEKECSQRWTTANHTVLMIIDHHLKKMHMDMMSCSTNKN